jgi:hypothetical protein
MGYTVEGTEVKGYGPDWWRARRRRRGGGVGSSVQSGRVERREDSFSGFGEDGQR